jgi:hypothetical protein
MSIGGFGSAIGGVGSQYDFTNMSNTQLYETAETLQGEGKISVDQMSALQYFAQEANSVPVNGSATPGAAVLDQSGTHDFLAEFQAIYKSLAETPGSKGAGLYESLVDTLRALHDGTSTSNGLSAKA